MNLRIGSAVAAVPKMLAAPALPRPVLESNEQDARRALGLPAEQLPQRKITGVSALATRSHSPPRACAGQAR
jgi:hypothetical protein